MASNDRLPTLIDIRRLRLDGGTQHRARTNDDVVAEYCEAYLEDKKMPPVKAVFDGENFWLWDGFHRIAGAKEAGKKGINVECTRGTQRDAFLLSLGANEGHGLRRSNEDKRSAVRAALQDTDLSFKTDREIARICGVSPNFVSTMRRPAEDPAARALPAAKTGSAEAASEPSGLSSDDICNKGQMPLPEVPLGPLPPSQPPIRQRVFPIGALEQITVERDLWHERYDEVAEELQAAMDEIRVLQSAVKIGSLEQALKDELAAVRKEMASLRGQFDGLTEERNAAVGRANHWKKKALAAGK